MHHAITDHCRILIAFADDHVHTALGQAERARLGLLRSFQITRLFRPMTIGDNVQVTALSGAEYFGFDRTERMIEYMTRMGVPVTTESFPIVTENHLVQWELAKHGVGVCFVMEEVGALNGTFVNGEKLITGRPHPLGEGDRLSLGMVKLVFRT